MSTPTCLNFCGMIGHRFATVLGNEVTGEWTTAQRAKQLGGARDVIYERTGSGWRKTRYVTDARKRRIEAMKATA